MAGRSRGWQRLGVVGVELNTRRTRRGIIGTIYAAHSIRRTCSTDENKPAAHFCAGMFTRAAAAYAVRAGPSEPEGPDDPHRMGVSITAWAAVAIKIRT